MSGLNACDYCSGVHETTAAALGVAPETLGTLLEDLEDLDTAQVDDRIRVVLRHAGKLTVTSDRVSPSDARAVLDADWPGGYARLETVPPSPLTTHTQESDVLHPTSSTDSERSTSTAP